jgi:hypothetical protein
MSIVTVSGHRRPRPPIVYPRPDILIRTEVPDGNASFEGGYDGAFGPSYADPQYVTRDTADAYSGVYSIRHDWSPTPDAEGGCVFWFGRPDGATAWNMSPFALNRCWVRFYLKVTNTISSVWKLAQFQSGGGGGGIYMGADVNSTTGNNLFAWNWNNEYAGVHNNSLGLGLTEADVIGRWISLEIDYWRTGDPSGWPSVAIWFNNAPITWNLAGDASPNYAIGNRLYAGQRNDTDPNGPLLNFFRFLGTLNQTNTTSGTARIDRVAFSSLGRIGP